MKTEILHSKAEDLPRWPKSTDTYPPSLLFFFLFFSFNVTNLILLFLAKKLYRHLIVIWKETQFSLVNLYISV